MLAAHVVELDPVSDGVRGVLHTLEAVAVNALLLQRPDHALAHTVPAREQCGVMNSCRRP